MAYNPSQRVSIFSMVNLAETGTLTASSEASGYPVGNVSPAGRPFAPWRSAVTTASHIKIQRVATGGVPLVVYLGNVNFTDVRIQASNTDDYTTVGVTYQNQQCTVGRNIINWRYQGGWVLPATFDTTYLRIRIPSQTPTDNSTWFSIGDFWIGAVTKVDLVYDVSYQTQTPRKLIEADSGAFTEEILMGEPYAKISAARRARIEKLTPGVADDFAAWTEIDRTMYGGGGLFVPSMNDPTMAFIVRQTGSYAWTRTRLNFMESRMELDEIVGP